jgi:CheY-like chemotaxis protein
MNEFRDKNCTVLIADDDLDDHHFLKRAISQLNLDHTCISVFNGLELMDRLVTGKTNPDLIILDLNMPLLDGFGALEKIRSDETFKSIPVFVLSTTHFEYDQQKAKLLGATDFYRKPYQYDKLKNIVQDMFNKSLAYRAG